MTISIHHRPAGMAVRVAILAMALACSPDDILEVTDPDVIDPSAVRDAPGAAALRIGALARFNTTTSGGESMFLYSGLLADEFRSSDTFSQRNETDQRRVQTSNANINTAYRDVHRARVSAMQAAVGLAEFSPDLVGELAEMFFVQAYTEVMLAEHFCSGMPMSTPTVFGQPLTTVEVFERSIAHADSALAIVGTDDLSLLVENAALVTKARAQLNLGQFAAAATTVAGVPTDFQYLHEQSQSSRDNGVWGLNNNARRYTVVNVDGGNGINFIAAADPRLPVTGPVVDGGFDGETDLYRQQLFPTRDTPFAVSSGVEARLIEAEAAIQAGNGAAALTILNNLRTPGGANSGVLQSGAPVPAGLAPLTLQVGQAAQIDQLMRERAFWLYGSGHRLGDLRRLIRQYGRNSETVFPTGNFHKTGTYGPDVNLPVTQAEENNPNFEGCINRDA
jgi:hypothetical protein